MSIIFTNFSKQVLFSLLFFIENLIDLLESNKKETKREPERVEPKTQAKPQEEKSSPIIPRVESDHVSQSAQKPLLDHPKKSQPQTQTQTESHDKPIGSNRTQNVHPTHNAHPTHQTSHQTHPSHTTHTTHNNHSTTQPTQNTQTPQGQEK